MRLLSSPFPLLLILICLLQPTLSAKSTATSFCKCICFNNSTIIALNPPPSSTRAARPHNLDVRSPAVHAGAGLFPGRDTDDEEDRAAAAASASAAAAPKEDDGDDANDHPPAAQPHKHHKLTCADCTRAFCLDYNLLICKNAGEEDVFTTCFQRDSLKDETVVVVFIFATAGLLGWALVKPWIDRLRERNTFMPLPQRDGPRTNSGR